MSTLEIPVSYSDVADIVPSLHQSGFDFIIHLGVGLNGMIRFERQAHSGGYLGKDIHGNTGPLEGDKVFQTTWNVENLSAEIRDMGFDV